MPYTTPKAPAIVTERKPAIVRNINARSYKGYFIAIIFLLGLNLLKSTDSLVSPANASGAIVAQPVQPAPTDSDLAPNVYRLIVQDDNSVILRQGDREVHVFTRKYKANANLFYVIDRDRK